MAHIYGIDLGTSYLKMFSASSNHIINERNVVAIVNKEDVYAFGNEAYEMYEKAPDYIDITFPIKNGVITDIDDVEMLLMCFQEKINHGKIIYNGDYCICVPTDITDVEKRAFYDLIYESRLKSRHVYVVEKPIADAVGCGVDVLTRKGAMIVNVGADTTEITVVSQGGIVVSKLIKVGGRYLDESICHIVKKHHHVAIGLKTAEQLKIKLSHAKAASETTERFYGINMVNGLPKAVEISSTLIYIAIQEALHSICACTKVMSERIPPEIAADIRQTGLYLVGGSSRIPGFNKLLEEECGLKVNMIKRPEESAIIGISRIIKNKPMHKLMYMPQTKD